MTCAKTYILSERTDPKCMNPDCKKDWDIDFLYSTFSKYFIHGKYKDHRKQLLFDREIAMLQATQPHVEEVIRQENIKLEIESLHNAKKELDNQLRLLASSLNTGNTGTDAAIKAKAVLYIGRCSQDECRGFISKYAVHNACGICDAKYCKTCMECIDCIVADVENEHICKQESIDTAKLLAADTHPCPTCAIPIYRISGCSQMFCTSCKSVFDWNTGIVESNANRMHNPHYYEYMASVGAGEGHDGQDVRARGRGGDACLNMFNITDFVRTNKLSKVTLTNLGNKLRACLHIQTQEMALYRNTYDAPAANAANEAIDPGFARNLDIRMKFIRNQMTQVKFQNLIQTREKAINKCRDIRDILDAIYQTGIALLTDLLFSYSNRCTAQHITELDEKFENLLNISTEALKKVSKKYDCVVPSMVTIFA